MNQSVCPSCNHPIENTDKFCPGCGKPLTQTTAAKPEKNLKTITGSSNYSGKMVTGKTSRSRKIIRNIIIAIVLIGIVAVIIWFNTDPDAKEKSGNILFGAVVIAIFVAVIRRKSKKGKIRSSKNRKANYDWDEVDEQDDDDFDDD